MSTKITVNRNGSLKIEGDFELLDHQGNAFDLSGRKAIALCRCGHTKNQPFCDGEHKRCEFQSEVVAIVLPPPPSKPA